MSKPGKKQSRRRRHHRSRSRRAHRGGNLGTAVLPFAFLGLAHMMKKNKTKRRTKKNYRGRKIK